MTAGAVPSLAGRWPGAVLLALAIGGCGPGATYTASELDQRPFPLQPVDVDFPAIAGPGQYYGRLELDLLIGADGTVEKIDVARADVPRAFLDAALRAFSASRWEPGRKAAHQVRSVKRIEVSFGPPPMREGRPLMQPES